MAMSPPLNNNSTQQQEGDEDKTKAKPNESTVGVRCVSENGKAGNANAAAVQIIHNLNQYPEGSVSKESRVATLHEEAGQRFWKISVPVTDGHTIVCVLRDGGIVKGFDYVLNDLVEQYPKHITKLRVKQFPSIEDTMQTHFEALFDVVDNLRTKFNAKLRRLRKGCLFLEFEHTSEKEAKEMVEDMSYVTRIFEDLAQKCGFPDEKVTVEAEYELRKEPEQEQCFAASTYSRTDALVKERESQTFFSRFQDFLMVLFGRSDAELDSKLLDSQSPDGDSVGYEDAELDSKLLDSQSPDGDSVGYEGQVHSEEGSIVQIGDVPKKDAFDRGKEEITKQVDHNPYSVKSDEDSTTELESDEDFIFAREYLPVKSDEDSTTELESDEDFIFALESDEDFIFAHPPIYHRHHRLYSQIYHRHHPLCGTVSLAKWSDQENMSYEVKRQLSGLRNGGGGRLKIHREQIKIHADFLDCFLPQCMDKCLLDGEFCDDVYTVEEEEDKTTIDAKKCSNLITLDYHTKIARGKDLINLNRRQMIELICRRQSRFTTKAKIRGKSYDLKNGKSVAFKQEGDPEIVTDTSKFVKRLFADLNLREYISAFSKNKEGGSYILPLKVSDKQEIESSLHDHVRENMIVLKTSHGWRTRWAHPPEDLTTIVFHPPESIQGKHLLEVSVRPFDGIVFCDKEGPESYKMNEQGQLVRLTKEEWLMECQSDREYYY